MNKKNNFLHSKTFLVLLVLLLISLVAGLGTYAWLTWRSTDNPTLTTTIGELYTVTFESGAGINANLTPVYDYADGYSTDFSIISTDSSSQGLVTVELNIDDIDDELCSESIKYVLYDETNGRIVSTGDLSEASSNSTITVIDNIALRYGTTAYTFYIYMDGNIENDISMMNKTLNGELSVYVVEGQLTAGQYITNLYLNSEKTNVTNNNITYSYANDESLMSDRFGGTSEQETGNLRYYGSDPDNYVYFNCDNYSDQDGTSCELWRIIGVFNGKLKLIRNEPLFRKDTYDQNGNPDYEKIAWDFDYNNDDTSTETDYQNTWSTSSLQSLLNNEYLDYENEDSITYWGFNRGATGSTTVNIQDYKIKNTTTLNMISTENWYLNPLSNNKNYPNTVYTIENTGNNIWNGKVGLISASDYAYSMNFNHCNAQLNNYGNSSCKDNSWVSKDVVDKNTGNVIVPATNFWTMTSGNGTQLIYTIKNVSTISTAQARIGLSYTIRPTIYLIANTKIVDGNGSISTPYKLN